MHSRMHEGIISWWLLVARDAALESICYSPGGREGSKDLDKIRRRQEVRGACKRQTTISGEASGARAPDTSRNGFLGHQGGFCPCLSPFLFREISFLNLWQCNVSLLHSSPCSGVHHLCRTHWAGCLWTPCSALLLMAEPQIMQNWAGRSPRILQNYANDS